MAVPALTALLGAHAAAGGASKSVTYLQQAGIATDLTTYTFSSQNLGAASAGRYIIVGIGSRCGSAMRTLSTVTVGGVSATEIVETGTDIGTTGAIAGIYVAAVPSGTTGDVVVTFSDGVLRCGIVLWSATGISTTANDSDVSSVDPGTATLNTTASGVLVGVSVTDGTTTYTWTNATEQYDGVIVGAEVASTMTAADTTTSSGTLAVTADPAATSGPATVFASW